MRDKIKAMAASDPDFAEAFRDRVLVRHDFAYFHNFFDKVSGQTAIEWYESVRSQNRSSEK